VLTGGDDAGTYTGTDNPNCALGFMGEGVWSVAYSIFEGSTAGQLSNLVVVYSPAGSKVDVGIGPLFDTAAGYNIYTIDTENGIGSGSVEVNDTGSTAALHATGTTDDGVGIDATVNCPSVTR
jgi:hypothetical protein